MRPSAPQGVYDTFHFSDSSPRTGPDGAKQLKFVKQIDSSLPLNWPERNYHSLGNEEKFEWSLKVDEKEMYLVTKIVRLRKRHSAVTNMWVPLLVSSRDLLMRLTDRRPYVAVLNQRTPTGIIPYVEGEGAGNTNDLKSGKARSTIFVLKSPLISLLSSTTRTSQGC